MSKSVLMEEALFRLQEELARAVAGEKFEEAARLRDEISKHQETLSTVKSDEDKEAIE
jgi:protein-arginine kinase activator protein McsA